MATNPMARKARNSFLLGVVSMLIIALIAGGIIYFFVIQKDKDKVDSRGKEIKVYVLNQNVKAGQEVTSAMLTEITSYENAVPEKTIGPGNLSTINENGDLVTSIAKTDLPKNTVLTEDLLKRSDLTDDLRITEYNMITLPVGLNVGDTIDIRLRLGNGADFIVISKKYVEDIYGDTITLELTDAEIIMLNSAIVESYLAKTAEVYAVKFVDGIQEESVSTYVPTADATNLLSNDPNIIVKLSRKNTQESRDAINTEVSKGDQSYLEEGMKTQMENAKKAREAYLNGLLTY